MANREWWQSRPGLLVQAVAAFLLAYLFFSLAVDSGHIWQYLLTLVLIILGIKFIVQSISRKHESQ